MGSIENVTNDSTSKTALKFVVLIGIVSFFADMTYEGGRSIAGPYLQILGASGALVGFVSGFGELIGYGVRIFSGYISDKTQRYWTIAYFGYIINLIAVPLVALAGDWELAAFFLIMERFGKGIRNPPRDAMLSYAGTQMGSGWAFGLHEALDQLGAVLGPLIVAIVLAINNNYNESFALLLIPALLALIILAFGRYSYPHPKRFDTSSTFLQTTGFPQVFWIYLLAMALLGMGFVDFPLIAYHLKSIALVPNIIIPIFYAIAMGIDGIAALAFGRLYDRTGMIILVFAAFVSSIIAPFAFMENSYSVLFGMICWGVSLGAQEALTGAIIGGMISKDKRSTAYGIFNTGYGFAWFIGSTLMGIFYDFSIPLLVAFSIITQLLSVPLLIFLSRRLSIS